MEYLFKSYHTSLEVIGEYFIDECDDIGVGRSINGI